MRKNTTTFKKTEGRDVELYTSVKVNQRTGPASSSNNDYNRPNLRRKRYRRGQEGGETLASWHFIPIKKEKRRRKSSQTRRTDWKRLFSFLFNDRVDHIWSRDYCAVLCRLAVYFVLSGCQCRRLSGWVDAVHSPNMVLPVHSLSVCLCSPASDDDDDLSHGRQHSNSFSFYTVNEIALSFQDLLLTFFCSFNSFSYSIFLSSHCPSGERLSCWPRAHTTHSSRD